jgi:hypothetical protein
MRHLRVNPGSKSEAEFSNAPRANFLAFTGN